MSATLTVITEDGERRRRSISQSSPAAVYDRLGYLHAMEGIDRVVIRGAEYRIDRPGPALVGAILRLGAGR